MRFERGQKVKIMTKDEMEESTFHVLQSKRLRDMQDKQSLWTLIMIFGWAVCFVQKQMTSASISCGCLPDSLI